MFCKIKLNFCQKSISQKLSRNVKLSNLVNKDCYYYYSLFCYYKIQNEKLPGICSVTHKNSSLIKIILNHVDADRAIETAVIVTFWTIRDIRKNLI
jgi:hypothetical protein